AGRRFACSSHLGTLMAAPSHTPRGMRISTRLFLGFGIILFFTLVVSGVALYVVEQVRGENARLQLADAIDRAMARATAEQLAYRVDFDGQHIERNEAELTTVQQRVADALQLSWDAEHEQILQR